MKILKNIALFIINPFRTFGLGKGADKITSNANKHEYLHYIFAFILAALIIYFKYF